MNNKFILHITNYISHINLKAKENEYPYRTFGIFGIITYPGYHIMWEIFYPQSRISSDLYLRIIATLLCTPLIFYAKWPKRFKTYISIYWYITILYCLPFFFFSILFINGFSQGDILNTFTIITLCILLLDTKSLLVIISLGIILALLRTVIFHPHILNNHIPDNIGTIIVLYITLIIFGSIFSKSKEELYRAKLKGMYESSAILAHELRTPLLAVKTYINGLRDCEKITYLSWQLHI